MKTKIKRHYRSVVSVLLSVCMLVSCMTVGLIATDAARVTEDEAVSATVKDDASVGAYSLHFINAYLYESNGTLVNAWYSINENETYDFTISTQGSYKFKFEAGYYPSNYGGGAEQYRNCWANLDVSDGYVTNSTNKWAQSWSNENSYTFKAKKYNFFWHGANEVNNGEKFQVQYDLVFAPENNPTKITAPTDCTATVSNGTTTITGTGSANSGSLTQNSTATVTITPPTGKKVTTATLTGGTSQTLNLISNHNGTYSATYTVPSNTTETAITFSGPVDKSSYKVNVVSSDVSEGTVAATVGDSPLDPDTPYPEDTVITLTATEENGFSFVKWDYKTTTDSSANPATYYVNGEDATGTTINITGEFGEHGYYIKIGTTGSYTAMTLLGNGKYISTAKVGSGNNDANKFMIKRSSDNNYANPGENDYKFNQGWKSGKPVGDGWVDNEPVHYFYQDNVSSGAALYVLYDPATDIISFSDDPQGHTPTTVLVKRGAVFSDGNGANISSTGTSVKNGTNVVSATVAGANKTSGFTDEWKETSNPAVSYVRQVDFTAAEVGKGAKITVATTVKDNTLKVVGFVVNGESVLGSDITVSDDTLTYTMTYTIPEYPDTKIEITPVYAKKSGTIRFYVEGVDGEIRTKWGDTVYCYAYYGSADTTATYGLGTWPGQPLLYDNGRYFIDLAEYDGNNKINGIALNNGTWDTVHAYRILGSQTDSDKNNNQCQSYDYDDFEKINNLENEKKQDNPSYVKADIIFEMKSKGVVTPENSNFAKTFDRSGSSYPSTIDVNNFTGWEYLTDYYGNRVDVFGNIINPTDTHYSDEPYRLVSQGYDENSVGYFATAWVVYQKSGSTYNKLTSVGSHGYVGTDSESKFLDSGLEDTEGWNALKGKPAMITYEYGVYQAKSNDGHSDDEVDKPATRYDGRWYASKEVSVKAHTLIEYGRTEHGTFRRDYYQEDNIDYISATGYDSTKTEGLVTKTKAHFSESPNLTESEKTTAKNQDGSSVNKFNFVAEDDVEGKYTFIGWYKKNAKGEAERVSTKKNYSVDVKNEEVLIARFIKTPAGTVTITHELLTGSEGLGTTLNSVSIVESDRSKLVAAVDPNPITSSSTGAAKIDSKAITVENAFDDSKSNADRGRLVKIVLNTTPNGATFQHFHYDINKSGNPAQLTASAPGSPFEINVNEANATATIYIPLSYFFKEENGDKIFDEDKDTLKFYSELGMFTYSITYHYTSYRNNYGQQTYKVTGQFSAETMDKMVMGTLPEYNNQGSNVDAYVFENASDRTAFLNSIAPYENDWMKKFTWNTTYEGPNKITASYSVQSRNYVVDVYSNEPNAAKCDLTFKFPYDVETDSLEPDPTIAVPTKLQAVKEYLQTGIDYKTWYTTNGVKAYPTTEGGTQPDFITAPAKIKNGNTDEYFRYWSVKSSPTDNHYLAVEYTRCYSREFNLVAFQNLIIEPVYTPLANGEAIPNPYSEAKMQAVGATISFIENSRNQWNNDGGGNIKQSRHLQGDRIYTDFLLSVATDDNRYLNQYAAETYKVGLIIERVAELDKDNDNNYVVSKESEYKAKYDNQLNDADHIAMLNNYIQNSTDGTNSKKDANQVVILQGDQFDATKLDNKNRIEYYYSMSVRSHSGEFVDNGNKNYVYRAYSYLKKTNGNVVEYISTPVYFTIYDMASIANAADGEAYDRTIGR